MTVQDVIDQMDAAEAAALTQIDKAEKDLGHALSVLPTWRDKGAAALYQQAEEAKTAEKRAAIEADLTAKIRRLRTEGLEALVIEKRAAEAATFAAHLQEGPQGVTEWQEAQARAPFVKEELEKMAPEAIAERYRMLTAAKDKIGAWLTQRYGIEKIKGRIDAEAARGNFATGPEFWAPLNELQDAIGEAIGAKHKAELKRLDRLESQLRAHQTKTERDDIARKYGIKPRA